MKLWNKIKDGLGIYSKQALVTERGEVIFQDRNVSERGEEVYTTVFQTKRGIVLRSYESGTYYSYPIETKVRLEYWQMVDSKGKVRDWKFINVMKLHSGVKMNENKTF